MWACAEYGHWSPGADSVDEAIALFDGQSTLIDFGCGECKALDRFKQAGFNAVGTDIVALRPDVVEACLWSLPDTLSNVDYGFCADVMEHIPPEFVDAVLQCIAVKVRRTAFFRISIIPDSMGTLIGETLHLTVRPAEWWLMRIKAAFGASELVRAAQDHVIIVGVHI